MKTLNCGVIQLWKTKVSFKLFLGFLYKAV